MKIEKINNSTSFGYNKTLNKELISKIKASKENIEYMQELQKLSEHCNNLEDLIRATEADGGKAITLANLSEIFTSLKGSLCDWVSTLFPELQYAKREYNLYKAEMQKREIGDDSRHWLKNITQEIEYTANINDSDDELESVIDSYNKNKYGTSNVKDENLKNMPGAKLVVEYFPTKSAQKGFAGLGGMQELKDLLNERIVNFLKDPEQAKLDELEYGIEIPKGILMYGPQGCGKTTITEYLSVEAGVPLLKINSAKTGSKFIHETSENIANAFDYAEAYSKAINKPVIVMIDDADGLLASRNDDTARHHAEEMATFLDRIQQAGENNVVTIAATNKYDLMDDAVKSRFEEQIYVGLPDFEARKTLVKMFINSYPKGQELANNEDAMNYIAKIFESFPIRDIKMISKKALIEAKHDKRRNVEVRDFEKIISQNQKRKVKEDKFKPNSERKMIGFNK